MMFLKMMNVREVATYFDVSQKTVRRWISAGKLKVFQVGGVYRISDKQMQEFIAGNERQRATRTSC